MKKKVFLTVSLLGALPLLFSSCKHPPRHAVFLQIDYAGPQDTTSFKFVDSTVVLTREGQFYAIRAMRSADTIFLIRFEADTIDAKTEHKVITIDTNMSLPSRIHGFVQFRGSLLSEKALDAYLKLPYKSFSLSFGVNDSSAAVGTFAGFLFAPKKDTAVFISGNFSLSLPPPTN